MDPKRVVCLGAGFVGGPTMAVFASKHPEIQFTVLDLDSSKVDSWNSSSLPIYEPNLLEIIQTTRGQNLHFSTNISEEVLQSDMIFISVPTPTKTQGLGAGKACDLSYFESAVRMIASTLSSFKGTKTIVEKSTVPVRTAELVKEILTYNCKELDFSVISNPEFLAEGTAVNDLLFPSRVLIGGESQAAVQSLASLYAKWVPLDKIITTSLWSSELSKLCSNAMLAQRVSSINSISAICEKVGADVDEVSKVLSKDDRIGAKFLQTSIGFGGSCFKKDVFCLVYICETFGLFEVAEYWKQVIVMNQFQRNRFSRIITRMVVSLRDKMFAVFGFAYKKNTSDTRDSAAAYVCHSLIVEGAVLNVFDPKVARVQMVNEMNSQGFLEGIDAEKKMVSFADPYEAVKGCCAIVVLTEWDLFRGLDFEIMFNSMTKPAFVFDGRNLLDHSNLKKIGFKVVAIGKSEFCMQVN
jgi:UDPglucose 6-dehydrogenase